MSCFGTFMPWLSSIIYGMRERMPANFCSLEDGGCCLSTFSSSEILFNTIS